MGDEQRQCPQCFTYNNSHTFYCSKCGSALEEDQKTLSYGDIEKAALIDALVFKPGEFFDNRFRIIEEVGRVDRFMSKYGGRVLRQEGPKGGFVAIMDPGAGQRGDWGEGLRKRLSGLRETGRLGEMGIGKAVFVHKSGENRSVVLTIWLDKDFSVRSLKGKPGEDLPGSDEPEIPRYPGSSRLFSMQEKGEAWRTHTLVYESSDDITAQYLHFKAQMKALGWGEGPLPDAAASTTGPKGEQVRVLVFTKGTKECAITLQEDRKKGNVKTVIAHRIGLS